MFEWIAGLIIIITLIEIGHRVYKIQKLLESRDNKSKKGVW